MLNHDTWLCRRARFGFLLAVVCSNSVTSFGSAYSSTAPTSKSLRTSTSYRTTTTSSSSTARFYRRSVDYQPTRREYSTTSRSSSNGSAMDSTAPLVVVPATDTVRSHRRLHRQESTIWQQPQAATSRHTTTTAALGVTTVFAAGIPMALMMIMTAAVSTDAAMLWCGPLLVCVAAATGLLLGAPDDSPHETMDHVLKLQQSNEDPNKIMTLMLLQTMVTALADELVWRVGLFGALDVLSIQNLDATTAALVTIPIAAVAATSMFIPEGGFLSRVGIIRNAVYTALFLFMGGLGPALAVHMAVDCHMAAVAWNGAAVQKSWVEENCKDLAGACSCTDLAVRRLFYGWDRSHRHMLSRDDCQAALLYAGIRDANAHCNRNDVTLVQFTNMLREIHHKQQ